jgi:8-oxo-dGTP diphosphatase
MTNNISFFLYFSLINRFSILIAMGESERYPISLNAVNVVCFKIDWDERMLNVLLVKRSINPQKNKWSLPGGFVQNDETLEEAARRIFIKETGIAPSYLSQFRTYSSTKRDKRSTQYNTNEKTRVITTAFTAIYTKNEELQLDDESEDIRWFKIPRRYLTRYIPENMAFDHYDMLLDASNRLRISLEYSGLATRFLPEHFTLGQIQDIYEIIWEVELDPANFREKLTNVEGWIKESKTGPKDALPRRGKPPTWYKEHDIPQFDRMITNPNGAVIREKESEYQKNLDNLTGEIPIVSDKK